MTQEQFFKRNSELHDEAKKITVIKNGKYSPFEDPFDNYRLYGLSQIIGEAYCCVKALYNYDRKLKDTGVKSLTDEKLKDVCLDLSNFAVMVKCFVEDSEDESLEDTIMDMSNYLHLLLGFVKDKEK